jgi:hypothetical protein
MHMQLPPPFPPGFLPPPLDWFQFAMLYAAVLEVVVLACPRKIRIRILETLFPRLRRPL